MNRKTADELKELIVRLCNLFEERGDQNRIRIADNLDIVIENSKSLTEMRKEIGTITRKISDLIENEVENVNS